jgi:hypothetical protein
MASTARWAAAVSFAELIKPAFEYRFRPGNDTFSRTLKSTIRPH